MRFKTLKELKALRFHASEGMRHHRRRCSIHFYHECALHPLHSPAASHHYSLPRLQHPCLLLLHCQTAPSLHRLQANRRGYPSMWQHLRWGWQFLHWSNFCSPDSWPRYIILPCCDRSVDRCHDPEQPRNAHQDDAGNGKPEGNLVGRVGDVEYKECSTSEEGND